MKSKIVVFSDFDGTITEKDVILMIMEEFAPPEWLEIKDKILHKRSITLKDGVEKLFNLINSESKDKLITYVTKNVKIRTGFKDFLDFCNFNKMVFKVVSGGLNFFIEPLLESHKDSLEIICNDADFNSERIKINYKYLPKNCNLCGNCGCCKIEIIEQYPKEKYKRVLIGDSLTDLAASKVVDLVYARSHLIEYLRQENISYIPFENFYDIKAHMEKTLLKIKQ